MRKAWLSLQLVFQLCASLCAQRNPDLQQKPLAIIHVTIIDALFARPKRDMTVIVAKGNIVSVGSSARVRIPKGAQLLYGRGKFLIPGLWDMHVHLGTDDFDKNGYLQLFIANGITGIRIMDGRPAHHLWRREIEAGQLVGPRMVIASRIIGFPNPVSETEARLAVRRARQEGADFVKVHDYLSRDAYFGLIDEARTLGFQVAGHVPASITAVEASNAGQRSIEHLTGLAPAESDSKTASEWLAIFKRNQTWQCPTLIMRHSYALLNDRSRATDFRLRYVESSVRDRWLRMTNESQGWPAGEAGKRRETIRKEDALVGEMQRMGVGILAGTDNGNPYCFPGFSLHDELALLVDSGLTSLQALQAATLNPAKFFNRLNVLGTIEKGKIADLVLLDANPLDDIHNTRKIDAVITNGVFLDRKQLKKMLAEVESAAKRN